MFAVKAFKDSDRKGRKGGAKDAKKTMLQESAASVQNTQTGLYLDCDGDRGFGAGDGVIEGIALDRFAAGFPDEAD